MDSLGDGIPNLTSKPAMARSQMAKSAKKPMRNPLAEEQQRQKTQKAQEATSGLANLFKNRPSAYVSVLKSLEDIGLEPKMMTVTIADEPVDCFVIPMQELIYKEWQRMSGAGYEVTPIKPQMREDESE
jgi:hypothetical protein